MSKLLRSALICLVGLGLTAGLNVAVSGTANAADKKETDSVVTVLNTTYMNDVTDSVLEQVNLPVADGWKICFVRPLDPEAPSAVHGYATENRLFINVWAQMEEGTTLLETLLVQACTETKITSPFRVSVIVQNPFRPVLSTHLTPKGHCQVMFTNADDTLTADIGLSDNKEGFYRSRTAAPGTTRTITLPRKAPKIVRIYQSLHSDLGFMGLDPLVLNTRTCVWDYAWDSDK